MSVACDGAYDCWAIEDQRFLVANGVGDLAAFRVQICRAQPNELTFSETRVCFVQCLRRRAGGLGWRSPYSLR